MPDPALVVLAFLVFVVLGVVLYVTWHNNRRR